MGHCTKTFECTPLLQNTSICGRPWQRWDLLECEDTIFCITNLLICVDSGLQQSIFGRSRRCAHCCWGRSFGDAADRTIIKSMLCTCAANVCPYQLTSTHFTMSYRGIQIEPDIGGWGSHETWTTGEKACWTILNDPTSTIIRFGFGTAKMGVLIWTIRFPLRTVQILFCFLPRSELQTNLDEADIVGRPRNLEQKVKSVCADMYPPSWAFFRPPVPDVIPDLWILSQLIGVWIRMGVLCLCVDVVHSCHVAIPQTGVSLKA